MFLLIYDISGKEDVHGLRMRLIYALRKHDAIQLMRATWLISTIDPEIQTILDECIYHGFPIMVTEWNPLYLPEQIHGKNPTLKELLIGIVIHSPEVTELGITADFLERLEGEGIHYQAILGGVMGRLAILDAKLEEKIFIDHPYKPSEAIDYLIKRNVDLIVLLNQGISQESAIKFGQQVIEHSKLLPFYKIPVIQLDQLRSSDAFLLNWSHEHRIFQEWLTKRYNLSKIVAPPRQESLKIEGDTVTRILMAVHLGDKILVNGVIIGEVTSDQVEIITKSGKIHEIKGGRENLHGIEKLGPVDLKNARTTTLKSLRRVHQSIQRQIPSHQKTNIAMLTWRGEKVYFHADKIDCVISIGDDTTFVSTEIISRFNLPIIGIIDGDADGILYDNMNISQLAEIAPENSLFIQVQPGMDDIVGNIINQEIFKNKSKIKYSNLTQLKKKILNCAEKYIIEKISK